jgi:hypothetical protein
MGPICLVSRITDWRQAQVYSSGWIWEPLFLRNLRPEDLFRPETWKHFAAFVRVVPDGDILPSRAKYSQQSNDWQVAVNHIYAASTDPDDGQWF